MSTTIKTPGVYIQELDAFGSSIDPVPTAVPAFIGYTAKTSFKGKTLINKAVKVTSLAEFLTIFGNTPPQVKYNITSAILPDRLTTLQNVVNVTAKALTIANNAVTKAGEKDKATKDQNDVANNAYKVAKSAESELSAAQEDRNIKALLAAERDLKANTDPAKASSLKAKVKKAQSVFDAIIKNANFTTDGYAYNISSTTINYRLYSSLKFFYENGGGNCYILSVGAYDYSKSAITDTSDFLKAITFLEKEIEPTMLVIPDAVEVVNVNGTTLQDKYANAYSLQNAMINHCGEMMNRVAILDIPGGYNEPLVGTTSIEQFRNSVEPSDPNYKSFAAAYYPWLHTSIYQTSEISFNNIDKQSYSQVVLLLNSEFANSSGIINPDMGEIISAFGNTPKTSLKNADKILQNLSKSYQLLISAIMANMNLMAPSAGMAGIYTSVDSNRGVWKAPANVVVQGAISAAIKIDNAAQADLNTPINGKSVCAIREFPGMGILVWGARTLDGNSNDWRYINVRITVNYIEQSIKNAIKAFVFEPNTANSWENVKNLIDNFLIELWKQGGLAGSKPTDAFSVKVGLGSTMTNVDIQNGIMRVMVMVALVRPAEFIVINFQQEMQKA
jgi:phage tail sheath protein FI